ncbi:MAG: hypothetical protein QM811_13445 [Pirellulales bacterium]
MSTAMATSVKLSRDKRITGKHRLTYEDKLLLLDPDAPTKLTDFRVQKLYRLFCCRKSDGICTRTSGGPRDWTKKRGLIAKEDLVRHLLRDISPHHRPVWYGVRSFPTSCYVAIDVDADRTISSPGNGKESFRARCEILESALRRMNVDPTDKRSVMIERTPSGGRHYYLFFNARYYLDDLQKLFEKAGLRFQKGEFEFFPSESQGLRLPFGHLPDEVRSPREWIRFAEAFRRRQIKRHFPGDLEEALLRSRTSQSKPREIETAKTAKHAALLRGEKPASPRRSRYHATDCPRSKECAKLTAENIQQLWQDGITHQGTRLEVLKALAANRVFVRGMSSQDAAAELIVWAMTPRHRSQDIQQDLRNGTQRVANQIIAMCRWYASRRSTAIPPVRYETTVLDHIRTALQNAPKESRQGLAVFILHFWSFALKHGERDEQGGWVCQPAVKEVIRKWPGCSHMRYKPYLELAINLGIITKIKGAWHNHIGKGRATTYRINITGTGATTLKGCDLNDAIKYLAEDRADISVLVEAYSSQPSTDHTGEVTNGYNDHESSSRSSRRAENCSASLSSALPPSSADRRVDSTPQAGPRRRAAAPGIPNPIVRDRRRTCCSRDYHRRHRRRYRLLNHPFRSLRHPHQDKEARNQYFIQSEILFDLKMNRQALKYSAREGQDISVCGRGSHRIRHLSTHDLYSYHKEIKVTWKLPNDAVSHYRPQTLSEFLGLANRPAIQGLQAATQPTWSGKNLLCGPRKSGLSSLISLMARDVNGIPPSPKYFSVPPEVAWTELHPGVKTYHGRRETLFFDGRIVSLHDFQRTIATIYQTAKRYVLIDNLERFASPEALNAVCDYIRDTPDDIIVTVHTEEIKELVRDRLTCDLHNILQVIPISYPEPACVEQLLGDLSERDLISIEDPYVDHIISLAQGDLIKALWFLEDGKHIDQEGYCAQLEWLLAIQ